jgi:hypothetical protein
MDAALTNVTGHTIAGIMQIAALFIASAQNSGDPVEEWIADSVKEGVGTIILQMVPRMAPLGQQQAAPGQKSCQWRRRAVAEVMGYLGNGGENPDVHQDI